MSSQTLDAQDLVLSVSEFNKIINQHLRSLGEVSIEGEISQLNISQGKWIFMTIKDENSRVQIFATTYKIPSIDIYEEGMKVQVYGQASLYEKSGRFSFNAFKIRAAGHGSLKLAYERLKEKLKKEGLFDVARKRKLPRFPQNIALITAKNSRAYGDFIKVLQARMGGLTIHFYPVQVQGQQSVDSILKAFNYFNSLERQVDVIVMTRGGGSLEDLISFNDEKVARAVFQSKIPVLSAIGHEDDTALTDMVADLRASTPSNAAELLVESREELETQIDHVILKINHHIKRKLSDYQEKLNNNLYILGSLIHGYHNRFLQLISQFRLKIANNLNEIMVKKEKSHRIAQDLFSVYQRKIELYQNKAEHLHQILNSYDYRKVLKRGFAIVTGKNDQIIRNKAQFETNRDDHYKIQVSDGQVVVKYLESIKTERK